MENVDFLIEVPQKWLILLNNSNQITRGDLECFCGGAFADGFDGEGFLHVFQAKPTGGFMTHKMDSLKSIKSQETGLISPFSFLNNHQWVYKDLWVSLFYWRNKHSLGNSDKDWSLFYFPKTADDFINIYISFSTLWVEKLQHRIHDARNILQFQMMINLRFTLCFFFKFLSLNSNISKIYRPTKWPGKQKNEALENRGPPEY